MTFSISNLLLPQQVTLGIDATGKKDAIRAVVESLIDNPVVHDLNQLADDILQRESFMSTGVGYGLALPHAKSNGVSATVAGMGITSSPIDYDAIDGQPVRIIFLLAGPPGESSRHIRILSRVSRLMSQRSFRESLLESSSVEEILHELDAVENSLLQVQ